MTRKKTLDFSNTPKIPAFRSGKPKSTTERQLRARARRKVAKGKSPQEELNLLYKPIEAWDAEELARGRPRSIDGDFKGRPPSWVSRELYEQAMQQFQRLIKERVQQEAAGAIDIVSFLLHCEEVDDKGKPIVPASVKLDAAKWLTEHIIGKPTQRVEQDISLKLQGVLAQSIWQPGMPAPALQGPVEPVIKSTMNTADVWDVEAEDDDE